MKATSTVAQMVEVDFHSAHVLKEIGVNYLQALDKPLSEVCENENLGLDELLARVRLRRSANSTEAMFEALSVPEVIERLDHDHQNVCSKSLREMDRLVSRVLEAAENCCPEILRIADQFFLFQRTVRSHMMTEELLLEPMLSRVSGQSSGIFLIHESYRGELRHVLQALEGDHFLLIQQVRDMLSGLSELDGHMRRATLLARFRMALQDFQQLMETHINIESKILYPRLIGGAQHI